jgi:hypothetical protein
MTKQDRDILANLRIAHAPGSALAFIANEKSETRDWQYTCYRAHRPGTIAQNVAWHITKMLRTRLEHLHDVWY